MSRSAYYGGEVVQKLLAGLDLALKGETEDKGLENRGATMDDASSQPGSSRWSVSSWCKVGGACTDDFRMTDMHGLTFLSLYLVNFSTSPSFLLLFSSYSFSFAFFSSTHCISASLSLSLSFPPLHVGRQLRLCPRASNQHAPSSLQPASHHHVWFASVSDERVAVVNHGGMMCVW